MAEKDNPDNHATPVERLVTLPETATKEEITLNAQRELEDMVPNATTVVNLDISPETAVLPNPTTERKLATTAAALLTSPRIALSPSD